MLLYRYRSASELAFKELLYNELYFASQEELNDPFDGESFYHFPSDKELWVRILSEVNKEEQEMMFNLPTEISVVHIELIATALSKRNPISYGEIMGGRLTDIFADVVSEQSAINIMPKDITWFANAVQRYLSYSSPGLGYFVSFSATSNDHLMWGHYGAQHSGYSLIFRTIEGALRQDPANYKDSIGVSENYSISVPNPIPCTEVKYSENIEYHNACWLLPEHLVSDLNCIDLSEIRTHWEKSDNFLSSKHVSWEYEKEYRLILSGGSLSTDGLSSLQRLLHYDTSQLVGIIFGARMSDSHKERVKEIIRSKKVFSSPKHDSSHSFPFVFFQAKRSFNREIDVAPEEVFDCNFESQYTPEEISLWLERWKSGYALKFSANGECKPVTIS